MEQIILTKCDQSQLWQIFATEVLEKWSLSAIANKLNLAKGTIERWKQLQAIPLNYFDQINDLIDQPYRLQLNEISHYQHYDQFFTDPQVAKTLIDYSLNFIETHYEVDFKNYCLIEPAAGKGAFYLQFPKNRFKKVLGLDLEVQAPGVIKQDWLKYQPELINQPTIIIGNPPFGLRGQMALQFINHGAKFSDFICFILPPLFNSHGKGAPMLRVAPGWKLVSQLDLTNDQFYYPNGQAITIKSIFQIWTRFDHLQLKPLNAPVVKTNPWFKVYSLSNGKLSSQQRNVKMINQCDYYLPSTTFKPIRLYHRFADLPHCRGYGIKITKDKQHLSQIIRAIDWQTIAFQSTNSANNLRIDLIVQAITTRLELEDETK